LTGLVDKCQVPRAEHYFLQVETALPYVPVAASDVSYGFLNVFNVSGRTIPLAKVCTRMIALVSPVSMNAYYREWIDHLGGRTIRKLHFLTGGILICIAQSEDRP
jgi:hypothetical protein